MRSRTELVTVKLEGSEFEDDQTDFEDSEDDWQPQKSKKGKTSLLNTKSKKSPGRNAKKRGKVAITSRSHSSKRSKIDLSSSDETDESFDSYLCDDDNDDEIENEVEDEFIPTPSKENKENKTGAAKSPESTEEHSVDEEDEDEENDVNIVAIPLPLQRRSVSSSLKTIPDKNGIFTLHAFKDDVKNGFRDKKNLCLWRRDGTSLLQKYIRHSDNGGLIFTSTMVFSCWEDKRRDEYTEIRVQFVDVNSKKGNVRILEENEIPNSSSSDQEAAADDEDEPQPVSDDEESDEEE